MPAPGAGAGGGFDAAKLGEWKDELYARFKESNPRNEPLPQDDLLRLDVIPNRDLKLLMQVAESLTGDRLFIVMNNPATNQLLWKWRDEQEALKYQQCSSKEEEMVYDLIDNSGGDGIWSKNIAYRLNMQKQEKKLNGILKQLQVKGLIAPFKNVEYPNKRMFIKASIQPSSRATGGPWYTDQELDVALIRVLRRVVFDYIKRESSYRSTHGGGGGGGASRTQVPKKGVVRGTLDKGKKRSAEEMSEAPAAPSAKAAKTSATPAAAPPPPASASRRDAAAFLPLPAGYTGYPTVLEIARLISSTNIVKNDVLSVEHVKELVDILVWDKLVEPVKTDGRLGYRVTRVAKQSSDSWVGHEGDDAAGGPDPYVSPLTEAPCGRCPVFDLCEEGGPVGPSNCEYFKRWLELD
ncbi:hypothetical protein CDD83_3703 [Cordyceps sp. RAO-2017]|nr:hypothetical protein CDD83_3703 [Cordyceps sp. RAO-2017]